MDTTQSSETWCIDDTLFYPLGLMNHTTGNKTVFVAWSDKYLINFIFKKVSASANRCNKFIIKVPEEILDIIILEVNTLVLLRNGEVCYFSSIKSIHRIPWLNSGVRCISKSLEGFCLIRVLEDKRISLEIYNDAPNVGKTPQECIKTFDLTFDEKNIFDCEWSDETFTLTSVAITDENRKFFQFLLKETELQVSEVHLFSVSNSLFALHTGDEEDYEIKSLAPQVSNIELVTYLPEPNMLLVFLNCGIIEVWYMSKISLIIEKYSYINGNEFVHHTFAEGFLYLTDEQRVFRLKFDYDSVEHVCRVTEQSIDAPGMIAITYEEVSAKLVCLNNNNIFYHLSFDTEDQLEEEEETSQTSQQLFELTTDKVHEMLHKSQQLNEINSLPEKFDKRIEEEYKKQELIAVCRKNDIYAELFSAEISFCQHFPETEGKLIYPGTSGIPPFSYFAIISLKILTHEIFKSTIWNLMIAYSKHVRLLVITPELLEEKFSILIPIRRTGDELLPEFEIQMLAHVNVEQDFVCINIPVKVAEINVQKLFSRNQGLKDPTREHKSDSFLFRAATSQLTGGHIRKMFGLPENETVELDDLELTLYFLGEKVSIRFNDGSKEISVQSCDPVAVYYAKVCVSKYFWENFEPTSDGQEELRSTLLEMQCQVEKKYGALMENELHFASLKRVYERFRQELVWKF